MRFLWITFFGAVEGLRGQRRSRMTTTTLGVGAAGTLAVCPVRKARSPRGTETWCRRSPTCYTLPRAMPRPGLRRRQWLACALLVLFSVALRLPFLSVPMINDEGAYAFVARFWSSDYQLYRDIPFDRPQGLFLLYKIPVWVDGSVESIRLFAAIYNAGTCLAMLALVRSAFGTGAAWVAAGGLALFSTAPRIEGFTANAELFTNLPLVISAWMAWRHKWFAAGLFSGAAVVIKPNGIAGLILALAWVLACHDGWRGAARVMLGFGLLPLLCLVHGLFVGWSWFWDSFVTRRLLAFSFASNVSSTSRFLDGLEATVSSWAVPAVAAAWTLCRRRDAPVGFGLLWLGSSFVGMALGGMWYWHYFQQMIPPLLFVGAAAWTVRQESRLGLAWVAATVLAAALFVSREGAFWTRDPETISWTLYRRPAYLVSEKVAEEIRQRTRPEDRIYVAFSQAEIYYLSGRKPSVPQLFWNDVYFSRSAFEEVVSSLRSGDPALVVWVQPPPPHRMTSAAFAALLARHYEPVPDTPLPMYERRASSNLEQ